jgi:rhodanese-related sulfurtransferase
MKGILLIATMVLYVACAQNQKKVQYISVQDLKVALRETKNIQLVDVRTPSELDNGSISGAILINFWDDSFVEIATKKLNKGLPVYLYCSAGGRSSKAAEKLLDAGFTEVYSLQGGYTAWRKKTK